MSPTLNKLEAETREVAREAAPWIEKLARFGYAAKGVVYILVGVLAFQAAHGGGQATDSGGALRSMLDEPFGNVLLWLVAFGLFGYVVWRLVEALLNPEHDKTIKRLGYGISAILHTGLALETARMAMGKGAGRSGDQEATHWTAEAMSSPLGRWIVALAGIGIALFGLQQLRHAYHVKLDRQLSLGALSANARRWAVRVGRAGLAARGVVFGIIGGFVVLAALRTNPQEARGVGGALRTLEQQPYGPWLLGAVAAGLFAYGIYELLRARYRRIKAA